MTRGALGCQATDAHFTSAKSGGLAGAARRGEGVEGEEGHRGGDQGGEETDGEVNSWRTTAADEL